MGSSLYQKRKKRHHIPAQKEKIKGGTAHKCRHHINPLIPAGGRQRVGQQPRRQGEKEQKVQHGAQKGQPPPQRPTGVVPDPQQAPQQHAAAERPSLLGRFHPH
ncbi:MAG: hypothetical protein RR450_07585 [Oscillospiraceae bacterium]